MNKYNENENALKIKENKPKEVRENGVGKPLKILFICHGTTFLAPQPLINVEFFA